MHSKIQIIPYNESHKEDIIDLILSIQTKEFGIPISLKDQPDLENISAVYQRDSGNFWVAVINNHVIGTIALIDIGKQQGALRKMFVKHNYRGKEVASHLLNVLLTWCKEKKLKKIYLGTTTAYLAAHRFYEKNGFKEIPKAKLPANFPLIPVDSKFYSYLIK
ncbi:MAG: GNAT family N-acetyltransferase [Gammaproteobacteria bacterium]|nr:GNAT family N-acetyltransferase [Gammaproteobacteria bacterium]